MIYQCVLFKTVVTLCITRFTSRKHRNGTLKKNVKEIFDEDKMETCKRPLFSLLGTVLFMWMTYKREVYILSLYVFFSQT